MALMRKSTVCGLLCLIALSAAMGTKCSAQQPDPVELVNAAIANALHNFIVSQTYTFEHFADWKYYDKHGAMFRHDTYQFDVVFAARDWYFRLTARNGNLLIGAEAEREQRNWDEMISGMRARLHPELKRKSLYSFALRSQQGFR